MTSDLPTAPDGPDRNQIQVIGRAAAILRALEDEAAGLSLGQIARRVALARSTVQRIVGALEAEGFLIGASPSGRVVLGPTLQRLARSVQSDFAATLRPLLERLSGDLRETVDLALIKKDRLIFVDQVVGSHRLRTVSAVGESFPLFCTANGKAYLATLDDRGVERLVGGSLEPRTPQTLASLDALLADLDGVRRSGIAFDREEHTVGVCAVGIAVADGFGTRHAISIPVPSSRFDEVQSTAVPLLLALKDEIGDLVSGPRGS